MSDAMVANEEQARYWSENADTWMEVEGAFEEFGAPPGMAAMDALDLRAGMRVLDIGCGGGPTTLEIARRVGPDGAVVGVDIADELLSHARTRAADAGVGNARFVHADAQVHAFEAASFDAAYSRFGVMFFADLEAAFTNVRSALRPGGRLGFVSWQSPFVNEWILVPAIAASQVLGQLPTPPGPDEPSPFTLSDPERVRAILGAAGFADVVVDARTDHVEIDEEAVGRMAANSLRLGAVQQMVRDEDDATKERVREAIEAALRDRFANGVRTLARGVLVVTARNPA